jgi:DNA-binding MarR family transcriptional regulator
LIDPPLNKTQRVFERRENRNSDGVSRVKRVFNAIKKHGKVSVSKLHRESWKSSSARDFDRLLDRMERWNLITRQKLPTTGRPVVIVSLCAKELSDGR